MSGAWSRAGRTANQPRSRMNSEAGDGARTHDPQLGKMIPAPGRSATNDVERQCPCGIPGITGLGARMVA